jgi:hypothetical protein
MVFEVLHFCRFVTHGIFQGAQTSIYCCLEDNLVNGEFYSGIKLNSIAYNSIGA